MKKKFMPLLKIFFIGGATIFITLVIIGVAVALNWPWWAILFLLLFITGLLLGGIFIRRLLDQRMGNQFEESIVAQDNARIQTLPE
jgi:membrane protein implicated in regulation of membrane protease activity